MSYVDDPELDRSLRRWKVVGVVSLFTLAILFPLSRVVEASKRDDATSMMQESEIAMGRDIYASDCAMCHGDLGQGVDAPALNSKQLLDVTTEEHIYRLASVGIPGTAMSPWSEELGGPLTDEQLRAVAAYIMSWAPTAPDRPEWRTKFLGTPPPALPGQMSGMPGMDHTTGT